MIRFSWNIRGLNDSVKVVDVKKLLRRHQIQVMAISETRVREVNEAKIVAKFGSRWKWVVHNYAYSFP